MKVKIVKDRKESSERAISRFNKTVQASRKLNKVREARYHSAKPTKRIVRASAVKRSEYRAKRARTKFY